MFIETIPSCIGTFFVPPEVVYPRQALARLTLGVALLHIHSLIIPSSILHLQGDRHQETELTVIEHVLYTTCC